MYHIVIFEAMNEEELVPLTWVRDGQCFWPPRNVDKSTKAQTSPGYGWTPYRFSDNFTSGKLNFVKYFFKCLVLVTAIIYTMYSANIQFSYRYNNI